MENENKVNLIASTRDRPVCNSGWGDFFLKITPTNYFLYLKNLFYKGGLSG
jgi:hypothetical protein